MKAKLIFTSLLLTLSVSSAQASESRMPNILSAVSTNSVQTMSKSESAKARGEYIYCTVQWSGPIQCNAYYLNNPINTAPFNTQFSSLRYVGRWNGYYVSR